MEDVWLVIDLVQIFFFSGRISSHSGGPQTCYATENVTELLTLVPLLAKYWD